MDVCINAPHTTQQQQRASSLRRLTAVDRQPWGQGCVRTKDRNTDAKSPHRLSCAHHVPLNVSTRRTSPEEMEREAHCVMKVVHRVNGSTEVSTELHVHRHLPET